MPKCRTCGVEKPQTEFYFRKDSGRYRPECKVCWSDAQTLRALGITHGELLALEVRAGGKCECCGLELTSARNKRLSLDHDHRTGAVRGLLCTQCNTAIGLMDDDPKRLEAAIAYLNGERPHSTLVIK